MITGAQSGGVGAVSFGMDKTLFYLLAFGVLVLVILGAWKLAKILWAAFSG